MKKTMYSPAKGKETKKLKGFTLVELIVVMVILALLMALAIPQVTKYIDRAGEIAIKSEARSCYTAVQSFCAEKYGDNRWTGKTLADHIAADLAPNAGGLTCTGTGDNGTVTGSTTYTKYGSSEIWTTANVPTSGYITKITVNKTTVTELTYVNGGITIVYKNGEYKKQ